MSVDEFNGAFVADLIEEAEKAMFERIDAAGCEYNQWCWLKTQYTFSCETQDRNKDILFVITVCSI